MVKSLTPTQHCVKQQKNLYSLKTRNLGLRAVT